MVLVIAHWLTILARWTLGVLLVSWRYLWAVTPLHRSVEAGDIIDFPPLLPDRLVDDRSQTLERGVGPLFHRLFGVEIEGSSVTAAELVAKVAADLNQAVPAEVTAVERISDAPGELATGDEVVVRMRFYRRCGQRLHELVRASLTATPAPAAAQSPLEIDDLVLVPSGVEPHPLDRLTIRQHNPAR